MEYGICACRQHAIAYKGSKIIGRGGGLFYASMSLLQQLGEAHSLKSKLLTGVLLELCFDDVTGGFCEKTPGSTSDLPTCLIWRYWLESSQGFWVHLECDVGIYLNFSL